MKKPTHVKLGGFHARCIEEFQKKVEFDKEHKNFIEQAKAEQGRKLAMDMKYHFNRNLQSEVEIDFVNPDFPYIEVDGICFTLAKETSELMAVHLCAECKKPLIEMVISSPVSVGQFIFQVEGRIGAKCPSCWAKFLDNKYSENTKRL